MSWELRVDTRITVQQWECSDFSYRVHKYHKSSMALSLKNISPVKENIPAGPLSQRKKYPRLDIANSRSLRGTNNPYSPIMLPEPRPLVHDNELLMRDLSTVLGFCVKKLCRLLYSAMVRYFDIKIHGFKVSNLCCNGGVATIDNAAHWRAQVYHASPEPSFTLQHDVLQVNLGAVSI